MKILVVRRIMSKCNIVTYGCTTVPSFVESEGGK